VTTSVVLLVGATLFVRSLLNARTIDAGFDTEHVLDARVDVSLLQYDRARGEAYFRRLLDGVTALSGVRSAAFAEIVPLEGSNQATGLWIKGVADPGDGRRPSAYFNTVSARYLETLRIPLVAGREFTAEDRDGAPPVVIVNETMAKRLWPNESALGKELSVDGAGGPYARVVGIARDAKYNTLGEEPLTFMYLPIVQRYSHERVLHAQVVGPVAPAADAIRRLMRELDPALPPSSLRPIRDDMVVALLPARAGAIVLGTFGGLALLLATVGIYGVTSYAVSTRTREIGIRTALGAQRRDVLRLVVGDSMRVVLASAALGLGLSVALWRLASSLLYGVSPADVATLLSAALVLTSVALVASYLPARRAAAVDPNAALRLE
jgi:predicted permease